jgi:hypothetical protein
MTLIENKKPLQSKRKNVNFNQKRFLLQVYTFIFRMYEKPLKPILEGFYDMLSFSGVFRCRFNP